MQLTLNCLLALSSSTLPTPTCRLLFWLIIWLSKEWFFLQGTERGAGGIISFSATFNIIYNELPNSEMSEETMEMLNLALWYNQIYREGKSCHLCFLPSVASIQMEISRGTKSIGRIEKCMHSNCPTLLNLWIKPFKIESNSLLGRKAICRQPGRKCAVTPESYSFKLSHLRCLDNWVPWVFLFCSVK